jgi:SAM-dependent methyltransferase
MTENRFDQFAGRYSDILDRDVALSGETGAYFSECKARYLRDLVVKPGFSGTILDFGCGVGRLSRFLKSYLPAATVHGFDASAESIRNIDRALRSAGVFTTDSSKLASEYDVIVLANVLHHVAPPRRSELIGSLCRRLAGTGRLVVFEHNPLNPVTAWVVKRSPLDEDAVLLPRRTTHMQLSGAGLRVACDSYIVFFPRLLAWLRPMERLLAWCPLGAQYAVVAEKMPPAQSRAGSGAG